MSEFDNSNLNPDGLPNESVDPWDDIHLPGDDPSTNTLATSKYNLSSDPWAANNLPGGENFKENQEARRLSSIGAKESIKETLETGLEYLKQASHSKLGRIAVAASLLVGVLATQLPESETPSQPSSRTAEVELDESNEGPAEKTESDRSSLESMIDEVDPVEVRLVERREKSESLVPDGTNVCVEETVIKPQSFTAEAATDGRQIENTLSEAELETAREKIESAESVEEVHQILSRSLESIGVNSSFYSAEGFNDKENGPMISGTGSIATVTEDGFKLEPIANPVSDKYTANVSPEEITTEIAAQSAISILQSLGTLPVEIVSLSDEIVIVGTDHFRVNKDRGFRAGGFFFERNSGKIYLSEGIDIPIPEEFVMHEIGHAIHEAACQNKEDAVLEAEYDRLIELFDQEGTDLFPSDYSRKHHRELMGVVIEHLFSGGLRTTPDMTPQKRNTFEQLRALAIERLQEAIPELDAEAYVASVEADEMQIFDSEEDSSSPYDGTNALRTIYTDDAEQAAFSPAINLVSVDGTVQTIEALWTDFPDGNTSEVSASADIIEPFTRIQLSINETLGEESESVSQAAKDYLQSIVDNNPSRDFEASVTKKPTGHSLYVLILK